MSAFIGYPTETNKTAELSQRRPRDAPNIWVRWKVLATSPEICNSLFYRSIGLLRMCVQNWKFVALPVPEIIGVLKKFWQSLDTPTLLFLPNFKGFLFAWTLWIQVPNLKFVALPVPEKIGGIEKFWQSLDTPTLLFAKIFNALLFAWTLWIYLPSLKFVTLPVPEIIGGAQKIWAVPVYAHAPVFPKFLIGFCSYGQVRSGSRIVRRPLRRSSTMTAVDSLSP